MIKIISGNPPSQFVVQYIDSPITDIVTPDRVRCRNTNANINADTFYKFEIDVPEDVRESYVYRTQLLLLLLNLVFIIILEVPKTNLF